MQPTAAPRIARGAASAADPASPGLASSSVLVPIDRHRRRVLLFAGIGAGAYLLALLATIPARLVLPEDVPALGAVSGTVWHGEAALAGGDRLEWRFAPLRTLSSLAFAADFTVTGAQTDLAGRAALSPSRVRLDSVAGRADGTLLRAAFPDLPFTCELGLQVDVPRLTFGDGATDVAGEIRSTPGTCTALAGGTPAPIPALLATARAAGPNSTALVVTPATQRRETLARTVFTRDGRVSITVRPQGAALFPFASPPGGLSLETTL
ncbi:type II secretion system protein N [Sphingomonas arantia]|uniref:Type II secretion system protein N n=1 Tax=Sphingomonas arantia TaxID=1460676 RepID=A0ABW4TXP4_9SPHN